MSAPRPPYDRWRDAEGVHIPPGARVRQVGVHKAHGALPSRLGKLGSVVGCTLGCRLYVRFDGEYRQVSIRPHLVRVIPVVIPAAVALAELHESLLDDLATALNCHAELGAVTEVNRG